MKVIYKYPLKKIVVPNEIEVTVGSTFLRFGWDQKIKSLCVWYLVDLLNEDRLMLVTVYVMPTGLKFDNPIISSYSHIGTEIVGDLVWHGFKLG